MGFSDLLSKNFPKFLSILFSSNAFVGMAIMIFLSAKIGFLEKLSGGLDKLYVAHRYLGITIALLIGFHYLVKPGLKGGYWTKAADELARTSAKIAFFSLLAIIVLSLIKRSRFIPVEIPYHIWRQVHRLTGLVFVLAGLHIILIEKGSAVNFVHPYSQWMFLVWVAGTLCFLYTQFLPNPRSARYVLVGKKIHSEATEITLSPVSKKLKIRSGQFAFLKIRQKGLNEAHPFTVASIADDGALTFFIKPLGDFTKILREKLKIDARIKVSGGWGDFDFRKGSDKQIWIAGGIGITPFLAWSKEIKNTPNKDIILFYSVRNESEALELNHFLNLSDEFSNFEFVLVSSSVDGRLNAGDILRECKFDISKVEFWFCGPKPMRKSLEDGMAALGVKNKKFRFEHFEFK